MHSDSKCFASVWLHFKFWCSDISTDRRQDSRDSAWILILLFVCCQLSCPFLIRKRLSEQKENVFTAIWTLGQCHEMSNTNIFTTNIRSKIKSFLSNASFSSNVPNYSHCVKKVNMLVESWIPKPVIKKWMGKSEKNGLLSRECP